MSKTKDKFCNALGDIWAFEFANDSEGVGEQV